MQISFVIPAHNEESNIGKVIETILKQPPELVKEIIVADNNCTDRTAEIARSYPKTKVVFERNKGTNWARQAGASVAAGDVIAFIDADNWLPPNWSQVALQILQKRGVAAVSGPYVHREHRWWERMIAWIVVACVYYPTYLLVHYVFHRGSVVFGGNVAVRKESFLKAGGLDTSFTFFGDDTNTGVRLRKVGRVIFSLRLINLASTRRFVRKGYLNTLWHYFINYVWVILFNRQFTKT